jgi:BlaI family transcriptional regulator, penicillinase repressor
MEKLTHQEEDVMLRIWKITPCYIKDILATYEGEKPPYTTVASVVKNLQRKKFVKAKQYGNTYQYTPLIEQTEYKYDLMDHVMKNYFNNSFRGLVSYFAKEQKISPKELEDIAKMIEKGKE